MKEEACAELGAIRCKLGVANTSYRLLGCCLAPDYEWLSTYPEEYVRTYCQRGFRLRDPAVRMAFSQILPLDWTEVPHCAGEVASTWKEIDAILMQFGMGPLGVSIPIRDPQLGTAIFSVNAHCALDDWIEIRPELVAKTYVAAQYFHSRARGLWLKDAGMQALSPRERDVMRWAAEGKTVKETASLLCISESAVSQYLAKATVKLKARNKVQAAVRAAELRLLDRAC